ncbi:MAG: FtsX-like permease family protein [Roseivirga sp.]|nr:FtsX-like permease family protein [Roseivirga sp.]
MKNITLALRVLIKDKFYSLLNILGLAVGLAVAMIIFLYVQSDLSYDKMHSNHDHIFRVTSTYIVSGKADNFSVSSQFLPKALQAEYTEIEKYVRMRPGGRVLFTYGDKKFFESGVFFADSSTFSVFDYELLEGDPSTVLDNPNTIILTESLAKKHFGNRNPIGEILETPQYRLQVNGIMKDLPENVHIPIDGFISYATLETNKELLEQQRVSGGLWTPTDFVFLQFRQPEGAQKVLDQFSRFYDKYMAPFVQQANMDISFKPAFMPIADMHFTNNPPQFDLPTGNKNYTYIFTAIGIFILLLASINYMNLASARAANRSKEVGVRKALGSTKAALMAQFMSESIVIALVSLLLASGLVAGLVEGIGISNALDKHLTFAPLSNPTFSLSFVAITVLIGIISGLYPAFFLSSISTTSALKGAAKSGKGSMNMRRVLVTFQFFISIAVIISTLMMKNQIEFLSGQDLGFNKENVVIINMQDTTVSNRLDFIKGELMQNPNILGVTDAVVVGGDATLGNNLLGASKSLIRAETADSIVSDQTYPVMFIGDDYVKTMKLELVAGRDFDKDKPSDPRTGVLVNEAMARRMGWEEPLGREIGLPFGGELPKVIGVIKDFNAFSLHTSIEPMVIFHYKNNPFITQQFGGLPSFHISVSGKGLSGTMDYLERTFTELDPGHPFEYRFLDTRAEELYRADTRQSKLTGTLSYICIFISCLGLLGLASFSTSQRIKEIGVRKVLGASIFQLVYMIFRDVLALIIIGFVISIPVSYYIIDQWLQEFAYQMPLAQTLALAALLSGVLAIAVAFITVSYHSLKAASQNPVKALRYE